MLNVPDVAEELRISATQVYRLIREGHLPAINTGVRRKVVSREALDAWIRAGGVNGPGVGAPSDQPAPTPAAAAS